MNSTYTLPSPKTKGGMSVEEALSGRRSHRSFSREAISDQDLSQILWAAYGVTKPVPEYPMVRGGLRTAPSAGALYPLEIYVLVENVTNIEPGVYKYFPEGHKIIMVIDHNIKAELSAAAYNQTMIEVAPVCLFYTAVFKNSIARYGNRGRDRYICADLGHSAENVFLQAGALGLGTCPVGAFEDAKVKTVMQLPGEEEPLYIMPVGKFQS